MSFNRWKRFVIFLVVLFIATGCTRGEAALSETESRAMSQAQTAGERRPAQEALGPIVSWNPGETQENQGAHENASTEAALPAQPVQPVVGRPTETTIMGLGDAMTHMSIVKAGKKGDTYDFAPLFETAKTLFSSAHTTIANLETVVNDDKPFEGYPTFNAPTAFVTGLKTAGIDVLTTANNHGLDGGLKGVGTTLDAIRRDGLVASGSRKKGEEKTTPLVDSNGIKVAVLAYSETYNGIEASLSKEEIRAQLNLFDLATMKEDIKKARADGAEFIVIYPHGGVEYSAVKQYQRDLYRALIAAGADAVIGNHPHVTQIAEWVQAPGGRKGYIAYALGNLLSAQRVETMDNPDTEVSAAVTLHVKRDANGGIVLQTVDVQPLWVRRLKKDGGFDWAIIPTQEALRPGGNKMFTPALSESEMQRIERADAHIKELMRSPATVTIGVDGEKKADAQKGINE